MPLARISLTLSRHFSLSFIACGRSSGLHPVSSHSYCMYVRASRPAFARPYVGVHKSISLMSSSLLLQQGPACLVRLPLLIKYWVLLRNFICFMIITIATFKQYISVCVCVCVCVHRGRSGRFQRREAQQISSALILVWFGFFNGISTLLGHLMPNRSFKKNSIDAI